MKFSKYIIPPIALGMLVLAALIAMSGFASAQSTTTSATSTATTTPGTLALPTCVLSVDPTSLADTLGFSTLTWSSQNADTIVIEPGVGTSTQGSAISGTRTVFPTTTTTYRATASGPNGTSTCVATVTVQATSTAATSTTATSTAPSTGTATTTTGTSPTPIIGTTNSMGTTSTSTLMAEVDRLRGVLNNLIQQQGQDATTSPEQTQGGSAGSPSQPQTSQTAPTYPAAGSTPAPMVVDIGGNGNVLIRGIVTDVAPTSMTITSWGGSWTIRTSSGSSVVPRSSGSGDLSAIEEGHFVGVDGTLARDRAFTVDANFVRDWTTNPYVAPADTGTTGAGTTGTSTTNGTRPGTTTTTTPRTGTTSTSTINRAPTPTPTTPRATTTGTTSSQDQNGNGTTTNGGGGFLRDLFGI